MNRHIPDLCIQQIMSAYCVKGVLPNDEKPCPHGTINSGAKNSNSHLISIGRSSKEKGRVT